MRLRRLLIVAALAAAAVVPFLISSNANAVTVGQGSYASTRAAGTSGPSNQDHVAVTPKVTARMAGKPVPTNDWWSSLVWEFRPGASFSQNMFAHPLSFHAYANGLGMGYPTTVTLANSGKFYEYQHRDDLIVGMTGLNAPRTLVDGWSDWTVSPQWADGTRTFRATIGHGMPYVYGEAAGGRARVVFNGPMSIWQNSGNILGVTTNGHEYGLFAPTGAPWSVIGTAEASADAGFFSVALLPSRSAMALFTTYAYSFVTDTRVSWSYNPTNAQVTTTYTATTTARQGTQTGTLLAEYRQQWVRSPEAVTGFTYVSPRGLMKLREGARFTTRSTFNGVLPALPLADNADTARIRAGIDAVLAEGDHFFGKPGTYWQGKYLWRLATLVRIANQIGYTGARDQLLTIVRDRLTDWLTASSGETGRLFAYDPAWSTLIGYPAEFGSDTELNDHHFHYGYFVLAAAIVAQQDPSWASAARFGGMVKLLMKECDNWDRTDTRFPFLRHFDPYAGNSWASGHAGFGAGNNQESSSEAMMFATGAILFGQATGDLAMRDAAIYLYTTERNAIGDYWFDASNAVFPPEYGFDTAGLIWGDGADYATFFSAEPEMIHGINMLPITGGSLYHARWKSDIVQNFTEMRTRNGGTETVWQDILYEFLAIADPGQAMSLYNSASFTPEDGDSRPHSYHWISSLNAYGTPDVGVTADVPTYAVLNKAGAKTYAAYNGTAAAVTVHFSDGATLSVPAGATAWRSPAGTGVDLGGGGVTPSPTASPSAGPSPTPSPTGTPGSPTLFLRQGGGLTGTTGTAANDIVPSAGGTNHDGTPTNQLTYTASGVNLSFTGGVSTFDLFLDAGTVVGNGTQLRISYDLTGDGTWDRVETYRYFATDPVVGWEHYTQNAGLLSSSGTLGNLRNGRIRAEVWSAIGTGPTTLGVGNQSVLRLPFTT